MQELAAVSPPVPETLAEALSPAWLTAALATRFPGVEVTGVSRGPVVSRVSTNARFRVHCAGPRPAGLARDLCVKGYFTEAGRGAQRAGVPEANFYRHLAGPTGVRTLRPVYVDVDGDTLASVVITEDAVADGGTFLDALAPYTPDQTAASLEELATLHAATWLRPAYGRMDWLAPWLTRLGRSRGLPVIEANFDGPIGAGVPAAVRSARRLVDAYAAVGAAAATATPWSVIHGDTHIGNVFLAGDGRPSFVDWQLVQRGPWYIDVGYHLASALTVEDRRRSERDLVAHYLDRLAAGGLSSGDLPTAREVAAGLRQGLLHGFYLWSITQLVDPPITTALLERLGTAVDDHGALPRGGTD